MSRGRSEVFIFLLVKRCRWIGAVGCFASFSRGESTCLAFEIIPLLSGLCVMNKAYRSVWNESTGTWMAVQENAKGQGKRAKRSKSIVVVAALSSTGMLFAPGLAKAITNGAPGLELCYNGTPMGGSTNSDA